MAVSQEDVCRSDARFAQSYAQHRIYKHALKKVKENAPTRTDLSDLPESHFAHFQC